MARKKMVQDERYHDTLLLLKKYRDVVWSLSMSVEHVKSDFRTYYGGSIEDFLDSVYVAGADLSGTDIEERAKSIERSNKMLKFVDHAVQIMREKNNNGEVFYQVLYFNYLSPYESASNEDVTQALVDAGYPMCRKTMTEYRSLAVDCVSSILWGFSSRDCREILDRFVEE